MGHRTDKVRMSDEAVPQPVLGQGLYPRPGCELHGVSLPSNCFEKGSGGREKKEADKQHELEPKRSRRAVWPLLFVGPTLPP